MKYAIIGAGWAGCSAAVELAGQGHEVHLYEAARTLGGRAREVNVHATALDNGQHILLGAYQATLALLHTIGVDTRSALLRLPLQMCYPVHSGGMQFIAPKLPAPLHVLVALIRAQGLSRADKMTLARFSSTARWMDWELNTDCSVAELLQRFDQTERLIQLLWQPLCVAALNTPTERASAQVFLNVLKDSLGASRASSDMLIARTDLTRLLPQPAADYVVRHGGQIHLGCAVQAISANKNQWQLRLSTTQTEPVYDGVVLATPAEVSRELLTPLQLAQHIPVFEYEAISTCYLQYKPGTRLPRPLLALIERPQQQVWGQFVFDRSQLNMTPAQDGLLAVVISASGLALEQGHAELAANCARQLAEDLQRPELATPIWTQVISEKRATFACTPGLQRPDNVLPMQGLVLAGDYTASRYPATLEAAVQSGKIAAGLLGKA